MRTVKEKKNPLVPRLGKTDEEMNVYKVTLAVIRYSNAEFEPIIVVYSTCDNSTTILTLKLGFKKFFISLGVFRRRGRKAHRLM